MIKRFSKATSLLVAAATVGSLVPVTGVMAADYKRIESEEGTIYSAVAYNGAFVIDGNIVDEDTDAVYFLKDGKYTELEDIDSGADFAIFGKNYIDIDEADYFLDLTTGKVTDEEISEDAIDDAQTALKKVMKKVDRYDSNSSEPTLEALSGNKFAETWYVSKDDYKVDGTTASTIYTDAKGNYIDADYNIGKVKVAIGKDTANLTDTDSEEKINGVKIKASIDKAEDKTFYLGQDESFIYRVATINFSEEVDKVYGKAPNGTTITTDSFVSIQKISKAQASDEVDDAKYAKTVTSYAVTDVDGLFEGNVEEFYNLIKDGAEVSIVNGKIVARIFEDGEIKVQTASLKSKNGLYYLDVEDMSTEDAERVETDVNGNVWRLDGGYLYKFDNVDDWKKVYKVDGSMEEMSIYDDNNIILWSEDDEVYSILSKGSVNTEEDKEESEVKTGWIQNEDGSWNYLNDQGTKVTGWLQSPASGLWYYMDAEGKMMSNGWIKDGANWFYLGQSGAMATGWQMVDGTWYYLNPISGQYGGKGAMRTGWLNDNGTWYYLNASGAMLANTTVDGYKLGANGAWIR